MWLKKFKKGKSTKLSFLRNSRIAWWYFFQKKNKIPKWCDQKNVDKDSLAKLVHKITFWPILHNNSPHHLELASSSRRTCLILSKSPHHLVEIASSRRTRLIILSNLPHHLVELASSHRTRLIIHQTCIISSNLPDHLVKLT